MLALITTFQRKGSHAKGRGLMPVEECIGVRAQHICKLKPILYLTSTSLMFDVASLPTRLHPQF